VSSAEAIYSIRVAYPDYLERGRAQRAELPMYRDGSLAAPASGTFTLYDTGSTDLVTGSVSIVSDVAVYDLDASDLPSTLALGHGYREEWTLVCADGTERTYRRDAALVRSAPHPVLTDADLESVYTDLARQRAASQTTWQSYIDEAWKRILGRLESQGVFPDQIVSSWSLREVHAELTFHLICLNFAKSQGGRWLDLASAHKKEFEMAWSRLRFVVSTDDDGVADSSDLLAANKGVTYCNKAPATSWGGGWGL